VCSEQINIYKNIKRKHKHKQKQTNKSNQTQKTKHKNKRTSEERGLSALSGSRARVVVISPRHQTTTSTTNNPSSFDNLPFSTTITRPLSNQTLPPPSPSPPALDICGNVARGRKEAEEKKRCEEETVLM
jgi:hypothetical protein